MAAPGLRARLRAYLVAHGRAALAALGRVWRAPLPSGMTAAVIGIALALPAGFILVLDNLEQIVGGWEESGRISVFLTSDADLDEVAEAVAARAGIAEVERIPPERGLEELRARAEIDEALALLDTNPLPAALVVRPAGNLPPAAVEALAASLGNHPDVAQVRLDREWLERLHAAVRLLERGAWVVAGLLAAAVVLVVGNTIRLAIENRRDEIVIAKLIGATDGFVRRPFLYEGLWYGLVGGGVAYGLIEGSRWLLSGPAERLATVYGGGFTLAGPGLTGLAVLLGVGALLGLGGSWLAVGRHLAAIEPR